MDFDLVFEGGGAKGLAFVGALRAFERHGHAPARVIGTSAGAIVAMLVAAGYNADDCMVALNERLPNGKSRFTSFFELPQIEDNPQIADSLKYWVNSELDNPAIPNFIEPVVDNITDSLVKKEIIRHLVSLVIWGGWYAGNNLIAYFVEKLNQNGRNLGSSTLQEFSRATGRDLSVVASDVTGREMLVLNQRTSPDCPTAWAVRMSMSLPFAWHEVIWKPEWGLYRGRDLAGHKVVDGGLLSNFPIELLVSKDDQIEEIMGRDSASERVIGLLLDDTLPVPGAEKEQGSSNGVPAMLERIDFLSDMLARLTNMAETVTGARDKSTIEAYQQYVCRLPVHGYGTLEFDLTSERMAPILQAGEAAMEAYLQGMPG